MRPIEVASRQVLLSPRPAGSAPTHARLTVLYDSDCSFCSGCAALLRRLDSAHRLRIVALQSSHVASGLAQDELLAAIHVVDGDAHWDRGGAAFVRIASLVPALRPLAFALRLPFLRRCVERLYALIARNRHRLGGLFGLQRCDPGEANQ